MSSKSPVTGPVRVRFAPSPTGFLHVGGARTAIYNELLRKSLGGSHILRIEDTDQERSDDTMTQQIIDALEWLGIEIDEGPFHQSERMERHQQAARQLLDEDKAYVCFRTSEELEEKRKSLIGAGENYRYRTAFSSCGSDEAEQRIAAGESYVVRFRMPNEPVVVDDIVRGEVVFPLDSLDDLVILRSDGTPTYHLSVVCDDIDMGVTHVLRGEDHLSNTPKHIAMFKAMGADVPRFGHLPLILGADKRRLSKRTGSAAVEEFRDQGLLPQALYNYLALLGWSPGDDRELMPRDELIEAFTAERLGGGNAVFDIDKLRWMNALYMSRLDLDEIFDHLQPFLAEVGLDDAPSERLRQAVDLHRQRTKTLKDLAVSVLPYFQEQLDYDLDLTKKFRKQENLPAILDALREGYGALEVYDIESTERVLRELAEEHEVKAGFLIHPTRIALSGDKSGPPLFDLVVAMGRDHGQRHLSQFIDFLRANPIAAD